MEKKNLVIILVAILLLTSITATAKMGDKQTDAGVYSKYITPGKKMSLLGDEGESYGAPSGKVFFGPAIANTVAPSRWVWNTETTWQDRQKYITMGRQIAYAGYYNANCDYVYMNWAHWSRVGATDIRMIYFAVFDWGTGGWDLGTGGSGAVSENAWGRAPVLAITPDNGWSVNCYRTRADDTAPYYTGIAYSNDCATLSHNRDTVPPPPNIGTPDGGPPVSTGLCDDLDGDVAGHPYIFPHIDVDTTDDGRVITHVATYEGPYCDLPDDWIDVASICYMRKVADVENEPWGGTWEGPYFMDSSYLLSQIVRADRRPGNDTVYFAYMKPMYYASGPTGVGEHPCTNIYNSIFWQWTHDVVYKISPDDGVTWSEPIYVTDATSGFEDNKTEPVNQDLSALIDPDGTFHLVWNSQNWDAEDPCTPLYGSKLWHWDNSNNCISLAYDGTHPAYYHGQQPAGAWNIVVAKCNISWCDGKMYISFTRFGAHAVGDTAIDYGHNDYLNGDIMVVCSDTTGNLGQTWSEGVNLTDTESDECEAGDCFNEHWSSMAMYSSDSLMILYVEDKEPGAYGGGNDDNVSQTDNPLMFMTWPCFTMADVGSNSCVSTAPTDPTYPEIALAPLGQTTGCTTPAEYQTEVTLTNCGNQNLNYSAVSNQTWLTIESGESGPIAAGTGPRGADLPAWDGAPGCAAPAVISWKASSATLAPGGYDGTITVDIVEAGVDDILINVYVIAACQYYLPEYATITGGCWYVDLWNTPIAGNGVENQFLGNMTYYACGGDSTITPLYLEAVVVGWMEGSTKKLYGAAITQDSSDLFFRALDSLIFDSAGVPSAGQGYYHTLGAWSTPGDSVVKGTIEYFVPGHQDTPVIIEKIVLTNTGAVPLNNFIVGEEIDWDCDQDSALDMGGIDSARQMVYQRGHHNNDSIVAGLSPYTGHDGNFGAAAINGYDYAYYSLGWYPDTLYNHLTSLDGTYEIFEDSLNGTEMRTIHRYWEGSIEPGDSLVIIKVKAVSLDGILGLQANIDKGKTFISHYGDIYTPPPVGGTSLDNQDGYKPLDGDPTGTVWHELYPNFCTVWEVTDWVDNGDNILNYCDTVEFVNQADPLDTMREHVRLVTATMKVTPTAGGDTLYLDELTPNVANDDIYQPIGTFWHEVYPTYCTTYKITDWTDNGNGYLDSCDYIVLENKSQGGSADYHVANIATDIVTTTRITCQGKCGDANNDGTVNVSDAVKIINYVFVGGQEPQPVLACGDANNDGTVNVSDAVKVINYVFVGGAAPGDCNPGSANWYNGDCCPFTP